MTETISNTYIGIDERWDARALRRPLGAEAVISAWTTDAFLDVQADELASRYDTDPDDLHDLLHGVRSHLREAALTSAASPLMSEAAAVVGNLDHLVTAASTDAELAAYAAAAEAGAGGPIDGLLTELTMLRNAERASRVFVADNVTVTGVWPYSVRTSDADGRVTTRYRDGTDHAPRIGSLHAEA